MANIRVVREGGETRDEIVWQAQELDIHERPNGLAVAAIIAAAIGVFSMAAIAWLTVITGTWIVYPWYRAAPPAGTEDLTDYPRSLLLSDPDTDQWHKFGMEWKEHVAWVSPILATAVAFIVLYYGKQLIVDKNLRYASIVLWVLAFASAAVAGLLGAFITKSAPIQ